VTANVHPAPRELADLAVVMRPDWDRSQLEGAIDAARSGGGWSFPKVFSEVARLLVQEDSSPRDLTAAAEAAQRSHLQPRRPAAPSVAREWGQVCREVLAAQRGGAA
jgi:hypothetical protein